MPGSACLWGSTRPRNTVTQCSLQVPLTFVPPAPPMLIAASSQDPFTEIVEILFIVNRAFASAPQLQPPPCLRRRAQRTRIRGLPFTTPADGPLDPGLRVISLFGANRKVDSFSIAVG